MKDCLLVGVVCLVLGFLMRDFVYPKNKVENYKMSNNDKQVIIIAMSMFVILVIIIIGYVFSSGYKLHGSSKSIKPKTS
jgi:uncharacterized membrane-anchored protein